MESDVFGKLSRIALVSLAVMSCDSIDCTLYNSVDMFTNFYQGGKKVSLTGTLTVTVAGSDSVLINAESNASKLELPLSYYKDVDSIVLNVVGDGYDMRDTVFVEKTNTTHFESPDCPATMFHVITSVRSTHEFIDSITVISPYVNYARTENIQIHLHSSD